MTDGDGEDEFIAEYGLSGDVGYSIGITLLEQATANGHTPCVEILLTTCAFDIPDILYDREYNNQSNNNDGNNNGNNGENDRENGSPTSSVFPMVKASSLVSPSNIKTMNENRGKSRSGKKSKSRGVSDRSASRGVSPSSSLKQNVSFVSPTNASPTSPSLSQPLSLTMTGDNSPYQGERNQGQGQGSQGYKDDNDGVSSKGSDDGLNESEMSDEYPILRAIKLAKMFGFISIIEAIDDYVFKTIQEEYADDN